MDTSSLLRRYGPGQWPIDGVRWTIRSWETTQRASWPESAITQFLIPLANGPSNVAGRSSRNRLVATVGSKELSPITGSES
jgi:hypothetical protein